uniref:Wolf-Hirschhorn syndrome candidate 1-like 1 n=1 Tax=Nothobranchius kadleci TaxID=1051664 RepID=A0A1A8DB63_NOTKA
MDFSFSFMQGIMGNTIQQPPQLIDSANIRQEGTCDTGSDPGEDSGPSYDAALDAEFSYPPSASEDMPQVPNGYPPGLGIPPPSLVDCTPSSQPTHTLSNTPGGVLKKTSSPEIKLKIIKTYQNGKELFESALCGDLLQELQKESQKNEATQMQRRHERKKEKRKKSVRLQLQMKVHTRINTRGHREYHVQFFGSVAERAWIHEKRITTYQGKQQFDELQAETLRKTTNPVEKQKLLKPIPQRERAQWESSSEEKNQKGELDKKGSPKQNASCDAQQDSPPPPVRAWKTAAARKLLPVSITMKRLNVEITKCDWPLLQKNAASSPKKNKEEKEEGVEREARQPDLGYCSPEDSRAKPEPSPEEEEEGDEGDGDEEGDERRGSPASRRSEEGGNQQTSSPGSPHSSPHGSQERKPQRRSGRSRSESERGNDPIPKKKTKKEQAEMAPEATLKTGSQKGASEISDACKPLKKRSRASTDVEMASSQYRDSSDSDSRGLSDPQGLFGKSLDSPAAADADASDTQSVDSGLSRQDSSAGKRDTVCQICEVYGEGLLVCEGDCSRQFHLECLGLSSPPEGRFVCSECRNGSHPCFSCKEAGKEVTRCSVAGCGCYYHEECVQKLPGATSSSGGGFSCPQHSCSTCCLERDVQRASKGRLIRCIRCPLAYHPGDGCLAAGSVILTHHIMICSNHGSAKKNGLLSSPVNVGWCFLCARVQMHVADLSEIQRCNCKPTDEHPCSHDSQCLNRMLQYECHPQVCPAGDRCENQCFSKRLYAETEVVKTDGCGWGLRTNQDLHKGDFVTEYVGEVIDAEECQQRIKHAHEKHVTNFYMLTLTKDRVIDAGPKGNSARFMNHSCSPNCETQKWTVNGDVRIGLFALCDIEAGAELTFNYNLHCVGNRRMSCHCGSDNCSGFLGVQPTTAVVTEKEEKAKNAKLKPKKRKLRPESKHTHEYFCFCCGGGGELVMCDRKECPKAYHLLCLNLTKPPYGRWECPWHDCSICGAPASSLCDFCPRSFCQDHEMGALTASSLGDRPCCSSHNPLSPLGSSSAQPRRYSLSSVGVKPEPEAGQMTKE